METTKVTNGETTANIPKADLAWFLDKGWKEEKTEPKPNKPTNTKNNK